MGEIRGNNGNQAGQGGGGEGLDIATPSLQ